MVAIKGMKMPEGCRDCIFFGLLHSAPVCMALDMAILTTPLEDTDVYAYQKRNKNCPLVEMEDCLEDDESICRECEVGE